MSDNENDDIPTLGEIIFPGNPNKVVSQPSETDAETTAIKETTSETPPAKSVEQDGEPANRPRPSSFESLISTRIDHILEKHMEAAREEIVRMVMLELRARLPGTTRPGGDNI